MVGGTQSCLHHPSFFQALPVVVAVVVAVAVVAAAVVPEMVHAYVVPASTATLEQAPWMDNGHYYQSNSMLHRRRKK